MCRSIYLFLSLCFLLLSGEAVGQVGGPPPSVRGGQQPVVLEEPDTIDFTYLFSDNPDLEYPFRDTSLDNRFWQYDPIRQQVYDYGHLGNLGSAHQPLVYQPSFHRGFDVGYHQFDLYKLKHHQLPFYRLKKAFTNAYFSQGQTQEDAYFKAQFSRNFKNGINYSIEYKRINNAGAYASQKATDSSFGTGIWYHGPKGRYDGFFSYISNVIRQQDNGGIQQGLLTDNNRKQEFSIPVFLSDVAQTRHDQRSFSYTQHFRIAGRRGQVQQRPPNPNLPPPGITLPDSLRISRLDSLAKVEVDTSLSAVNDTLATELDTVATFSDSTLLLLDTVPLIDSLKLVDTLNNDSLAMSADSLGSKRPPLPPRPQAPLAKPEGRAFTLTHRVFYERSRFKFTDTNPADDSIFYRNLQVDQRGLRNFIQGRQIENSLSLSTSSLRKGKDKAQTGGTQRDLFEVGLTHSWYQLQQEPTDSTINNLFLNGRWNFTPSDRLQVRTYGHYGLWDQRGDYRLHGQLFFDLGKAGSLDIKGTSQQYSPSLLQKRVFIAQQEIWNTNFDKPLENSIQATYYQPLSDTRLSGQFHLITNYIYFDTLAIPQQDNGTISVLQLMAQQNFKFWKFHTESWAMLQQISGDKLRMPSFYFKQSLYFKGKLFKRVLDTYVGLDLRLSNAFRGNKYQPLIGQFHLQDSQELPLYPALDFFMAFKVKFFRAFFRMENLTAYFTNDFYYQTVNHPYPFGAIRFGISWQFLD